MKVGKIFLELLSKHFPRISLLHKSFSKTLKIIYTCMPKEKKIKQFKAQMIRCCIWGERLQKQPRKNVIAKMMQR